jgi:hypothetical protein
MAFASEGFGVVTRGQLLARGFDDAAIRRMVSLGEPARAAQRGVYVTGSSPAPEHPVDRWYLGCALALAAAGPTAVLGGETAANLWDLDGFDQFPFSGGRASAPPIIVQLPVASGRRSPNVRRSPLLEPAEHRHGLPVTSIGQTLLDLGYQLDEQRVRRGDRHGGWLSAADRVELATESALRRRLVTEDQLAALMGTASPRRGGWAVLHGVLGRRPLGAPPTESYLETRGIQVLRHAGLPTGERQVEIYDDGTFVARVDLQLSERVLVEFDGRAFHDRDPDDTARDRRRWTTLTTLGYEVAVFTFEDVEFQPDVVARQVRKLLARA